MLGALLYSTRRARIRPPAPKAGYRVVKFLIMASIWSALALLAFVGSCGRHW
jgi:hypothetical protein